MRKADKNNLVVLGVIVGFFLLFIAFYFGTKFVPLRLLVPVCLLFEYLYATPKLATEFGKMLEYDPGVSKWIPIVNQFQMFTGAVKVSAYITLIGAVAMFVGATVPMDVIARLLGEYQAMNLPYKLLFFGVVSFIVNTIIVGIGLVSVINEINYTYLEKFRKRYAPGYLNIVMMFVPLVRVCGILSLISVIESCNQAEDYDDTEFYEEEDEEVDEFSEGE